LLKFWFWIVATLLLYGALALVEGRPWPETLAFDSLHSLWFLQGFFQGQLTALWAGQLASRARLYQLIEGQSSGRALESRVRDFQLDADFSKTNEATLSASLGILATLAVGLATFSPFGAGGLSVALAVGFVVFCLLVGVLLRTYRREMETLMYGRRWTLAEKLAPLGWSTLLVVVAALGGWGLVAVGGPWVDWNALLQGQHTPVLPPLPESPPPRLIPPVGEGGDLRPAMMVTLLELIFRVRNLFFVVEWFVRLVTWAIPVAVVAFLLWPLARWLLSGGRDTRGLGRRWWAQLVAQWLAFRAMVAGWWRAPRSVAEPLSSASAREWVRSLFHRSGGSRRAPYPQVVEAFLTLVHWAEPLTPYHRGETTREFLDRLGVLAPSHAVELATIRDLLDQELFGPQGLGADQRTQFLSLVCGVTSAPPSHEAVPGVS